MAMNDCIPEALPDDSRDGWHVRECEQAIAQIAALGELLRVLPTGTDPSIFAAAPVSPHTLRVVGQLIKSLADRATAALPAEA